MAKTFATSDNFIYQPGRSPDQVPAPAVVQLAGYNDLYIGTDGNLALAGGTSENLDQLNAVLYSCQNLARSVLGEMILQVNRGLPDFETIWNGTPNLAQWELAFRNAMLTVDGVLEVVSVDMTRINDEFNYTATILTQYGEGAINGVV